MSLANKKTSIASMIHHTPSPSTSDMRSMNALTNVPPAQAKVIDIAEFNVSTFTWNKPPLGFDELTDSHDIQLTQKVIFELIRFFESKNDRAEQIFIETLEGSIYCYVIGLQLPLEQKDFACIKGFDSKITKVFVDPRYKYTEELAGIGSKECSSRSLPASSMIDTMALVVQFCKNDTLIEIQNSQSETEEDINSYLLNLPRNKPMTFEKEEHGTSSENGSSLSKKRKFSEMSRSDNEGDSGDEGEGHSKSLEPPRKKGLLSRIFGL